MALEHDKLTEAIIGAAIEVHRRLGPGFLESIYERALEIELHKRGLTIERQVEITVKYDDQPIGIHRLDMVVESLIVVELKTVKEIDDIHFAIVRSYLRAYQREHGLILNFSKPVLEIKRVIAKPPP